MKKLLSTIALLFTVAILSAQTVAVLGFESDDFCLESRTGTMSDLLSDELVRIEGITVLERKAIDKVIEEMDFQMSGWTDAKTVKAAGKMLNADCVITGSVSTLGATLYVTARMIEVESASISRRSLTTSRCSSLKCACARTCAS